MVQVMWYNNQKVNIMSEPQKNTKKYLIVLILRILESKTDAEHPITQTQIANEISEIYPCDRKTVGRNIQFLQKLKYPIVKTSNGFYMDNMVFSVSDMEFVEQAVLGSELKSDEEKAELLKKLKSLMTHKYKI